MTVAGAPSVRPRVAPVPERGLFKIALLDPEGLASDWAGDLAPGQPVEVVRCASGAELGRSGADLAVICAGPDGEAGSLGEVRAAAASLPVTLLAASPAAEHPTLRLMRALGKAKAEWEAAFDALLDPIAILDARGTVVRANLGFARSLGRDIRDVIGQPALALLGPAGTGPGGDPLAQSLVDGRARTAEVDYAQLKGPHQVGLSPLPADEAGPTGFVLLIKDLSEQKEQQERLFQAARLADVGHLAAGVAHEINTPLASIALRAESLLRSAEDPSLRDLPAFKNFARYLRTIEDEAFRCKKIIRALLEFSTRQRPEKKLVDLNALVESATELVEHQLRLGQVRLEKSLAPRLPSVPADEGQLRQVLIALLMNSLDATSAGGRVAVATAPEGPGSVRLSVEDDGVGIPREILDKIWSPFFSTKPFGQGTGLGLAICHGIVTAHGGAIEVRSEAGRGTRVDITLPVGEQEVKP
jgi:signal transduction histidine kinase